MKDEVYNRALFRRKSEAARQKLRDMGGVDKKPQGIMASSPELMMAAMPAMAPQVTGPRPTMQAPQMRQEAQPMQARPLPNIVPGLFPQMQQPAQQQAPQPGAQVQQQPMPQQQAQPQQQPQMQARPQPQQQQQQQKPAIRLAEGGPVDVTVTPVAETRDAGPMSTNEVMSALRERVAGDPEAEARAAEFEQTVTNPEIPEAERADVAAGAITGADTREGRAAALQEMTGRPVPQNMSVDEINQAITQVALGGAIGGPGSVAERISNAMMQGLAAKRETAVTREAEAARMRELQAQLAARRSSGRSAESGANAWLSSQQGKIASDLYEKLRQASWSHEDAIEELNKLGGNLGDTLQAAMAPGGAPTPEQGTTSASPAGLTNLMQNAEGVTIGWNGSQWVNAQTGEPYSG